MQIKKCKWWQMHCWHDDGTITIDERSPGYQIPNWRTYVREVCCRCQEERPKPIDYSGYCL
jgi:hypothetical protein